MVPNAQDIGVKIEKPRLTLQGSGRLNSASALTEQSSTSSIIKSESDAPVEAKTKEPESGDRKAISKPPTMKREQSDIFKSFSKPKAKLNREDAGSSDGASPAANTAPTPKQVTYCPRLYTSDSL